MKLPNSLELEHKSLKSAFSNGTIFKGRMRYTVLCVPCTCSIIDFVCQSQLYFHICKGTATATYIHSRCWCVAVVVSSRPAKRSVRGSAGLTFRKTCSNKLLLGDFFWDDDGPNQGCCKLCTILLATAVNDLSPQCHRPSSV